MKIYIKKIIIIVSLFVIFSNKFFIGVYSYTNDELNAANTLANLGIINNHSDNPSIYNLDQKVLRQEIAAVARGMAGLDKKTVCNNIFSDVSSLIPNNWTCLSVEALADANIIAKNINFNPERNISKAEALAMMINAADLAYEFNSFSSDSWQKQIVDFGINEGIVLEFSDYASEATRAWVFEVGASVIENSSNKADIDKVFDDLFQGIDEIN